MEIARLEVSTQRHIERMQETAKVNYVQYGRNKKPKPKPGKFQQPTANGSSGGSSGNPSKSSGKGKKVPLPTDICWRCGKGRHQKGQPVQSSWKQCAGIVPSKDTLRKSA